MLPLCIAIIATRYVMMKTTCRVHPHVSIKGFGEPKRRPIVKIRAIPLPGPAAVAAGACLPACLPKNELATQVWLLPGCRMCCASGVPPQELYPEGAVCVACICYAVPYQECTCMQTSVPYIHVHTDRRLWLSQTTHT